ncbi:MBL fold metallo-hydrolase [Sphingomonas sp. MMS24-JH45]
MVGHASLLIQAAGANILTDPIWSERASPVAFAGPKRVTAPGIRFDDLPPIDVVLLSHGHYDHLDVATLRRLHERDAPLIVAPLGNDTIVRDALPEPRVMAADWWDRVPLGAGFATTLTPANHWSNRWPSDARMMLWGGHRLDTPMGSVWFVGDTGYGDGRFVADVRARLGAPRVALIPIGAYAPR